MPSNKTLTVFILCFGVVLSVWLFTKKPSALNERVTAEKNSVVAEPAIKIEAGSNGDWKKILTTVDSKSQKVVDLTKKSTVEDDTTLTDQMSRDFLSQYLIAVKNGTEITPEVADTIAKNTLSLPDYNLNSAVYIRENIKITPKNDRETLVKYSQNINQALMSIYYNLKEDPMIILLTALQTQKESDLKKLDPVISMNKAVIEKLVQMEVPESAVKVHLDLLNISSKILLDLESMRAAISDPIKVFSVLGEYTEDFNTFKKVLVNVNDYLLKNSL